MDSQAGCCCRRPTGKPEECNKKQNGKTVLFMPLDNVGHVNSLISVADTLKHLGHRTVFLFYDPMKGDLVERGHEVYDCSQEGLIPSEPNAASEKKWDIIVNEMGKLWRGTVMENFTTTTRVGLGGMMRDIIKHEGRIERKLGLIKPDLIIVDHYYIQPAIIHYGKPWARIYSASPLALHPKAARLPPPTLGLPTDWLATKDPKQKAIYEAYAEEVTNVKMELYEEFNSYLVDEHKLESLPKDPISYIYESPFLNVYMCPEELDYDHVPKPKNWQRCDSILRANAPLPDPDQPVIEKQLPKFEIPEQLRDKPGKLILLSMGSLASGDVELMKRLVAILRKSPHRFLVCRGSNADKYELADNMWGERFLPQLSILPVIDLIITHGGNNTITECLYYGVPGFVVCPVFSDQYDNAQRIEEKRLGRRINPFHCTENELLGAVEDVLADQTIGPRMKAIQDRMQKPENKYKALRLFKDMVDKL